MAFGKKYEVEIMGRGIDSIQQYLDRLENIKPFRMFTCIISPRLHLVCRPQILRNCILLNVSAC
jgi:hypothetical protein